MAGAGVGGAGPGQGASCTRTVVLLWLLLMLLHAEPTRSAHTCGRPAVTGRILGGRDALEQRWPWQSSLLYRGAHVCGATLIGAFWVVSAAHCFQKSHRPSDYRILLGYHQLQRPQHSLQVTVNRVIVHGDFDKHYFMGSDIALLQLHWAVNFTSHVLPACLPGPDMKPPLHSSCWITGWGMVTEEAFLAPPFQLQEAEVSLLDSKACTMYFQGPDASNSRFSVHEDMLCAGDLMTGKSICCGDSGGPLVCKLNGTWFLLGLSSWSPPCRRPGGPSIFARLSYFSRWISEEQRASPEPNPASAPPQGKPPAVGGFTSGAAIHKSSTCLLLLMSLGAR